MEDYHRERFEAERSYEDQSRQLNEMDMWSFIIDRNGDIWLKHPGTFAPRIPWVKLTGDWPYTCVSSEGVPFPARTMSDSEAATKLTSDDLTQLDAIFGYNIVYATTPEAD